MVENVTFFDNEKDLSALTGLTRDELWDNGFDLDDMDFGIMTNREWFDLSEGNDPYYREWIINRMDNHCAGIQYTEYNGRHFYTVHH